LRGRLLSQYKFSTFCCAFRNQSDTSLTWKGGSPGPRSRLSTPVISSAVLGFLILFKARHICSSRGFAFGTCRIFGSLGVGSQFVKRCSFLCWCTCYVRDSSYAELAGTSWRIRLRIASGSCSPSEPAKVYVRSKLFGPSTRSSNSRSRAIRQSTLATPLVCRSNACSMLAEISFDS